MAVVIYIPDSTLGWFYLDFDLTLSETHELAADITDHPVEEGADITDNSRPQPRKFSCEVFITNTPVDQLGGYHAPDGVKQNVTKPYPVYSPPLALTPGAITNAIDSLISGARPPLSFSVLAYPTIFDAVKDTQSKLSDLLESGLPCKVFTSTLTYENCLLQQVTTTKEGPGAANYALAFSQIRTVQTANVAAPKPSAPRGVPAKAKGAQATKEGQPEPPASSFAVNLGKSAGIIK